jgi:hypothetical protein
MLCATCVSIFQTKPVLDVFPTIRGQHHASIKHVEAAAKQGCYLCSELILDYDYEEDQTLASSGDNGRSSALTFELRLAHSSTSPQGRLGELSFDSVDGRLASAGYEIIMAFLRKSRQTLMRSHGESGAMGFHLLLLQYQNRLATQPC